MTIEPRLEINDTLAAEALAGSKYFVCRGGALADWLIPMRAFSGLLSPFRDAPDLQHPRLHVVRHEFTNQIAASWNLGEFDRDWWQLLGVYAPSDRPIKFDQAGVVAPLHWVPETSC